MGGAKSRLSLQTTLGYFTDVEVTLQAGFFSPIGWSGSVVHVESRTNIDVFLKGNRWEYIPPVGVAFDKHLLLDMIVVPDPAVQVGVVHTRGPESLLDVRTLGWRKRSPIISYWGYNTCLYGGRWCIIRDVRHEIDQRNETLWGKWARK